MLQIVVHQEGLKAYYRLTVFMVMFPVPTTATTVLEWVASNALILMNCIVKLKKINNNNCIQLPTHFATKVIPTEFVTIKLHVVAMFGYAWDFLVLSIFHRMFSILS